MADRRDFSGNPNFHSCEELPYDRPGTPYTITGERNYVRKFRVIVRHRFMDALSVCLCPGLPVPGSFYLTNVSFDTLALVSEITADQEHRDDHQNWIVTVKYSTRMPQGGFPALAGTTPGSQDHPELEPAAVKWESETAQEKPYWDLDGWFYQNRAGQRLKDGTFPQAYTVLCIDRNELGFNNYKAMQYSFALNSDTFLECPPETVQCYPLTAVLQHRGSLAYYRVSYRLKFGYLVDREDTVGVNFITPDGEDITEEDRDYKVDNQGRPIGLRKWQPRILNEGTKYRKEAGGAAARKFGQGTVDAILLDKDGKETTRPHFIKFRQFRKLSFIDLVVNGLT